MKRSEPRLSLGRKLRRLRQRAALSQRELCKKLKYSSGQFASNWERGLSYPPDEKFADMAKLLHRPEREIIAITYSAKIADLIQAKKDLILRTGEQ